MSIPGTVQVTGQIAPTDVADTFPTHDAIYGKGGMTHAATLAARNAIPVERRRAGMLCYVDATDMVYRLKTDLTTWIDFSASGNGTTYLANYGDASPVPIFTLLSNQALDKIDVTIIQAFNGVGASIKIGVAGQDDRYFEAIDTELGLLATFSKDFSDLGPKIITITITPGTGASSGQVRIQISTTPSGT